MAFINRIVLLLNFYIKFWTKKAELYQFISTSILLTCFHLFNVKYNLDIYIFCISMYYILRIFYCDKWLYINNFFKIMQVSNIDISYAKSLLIFFLISFQFLIILSGNLIMGKNYPKDFHNLYLIVLYMIPGFLSFDRISRSALKILSYISIILIGSFIVHFATQFSLIVLLSFISVIISINSYESNCKF